MSVGTDRDDAAPMDALFVLLVLVLPAVLGLTALAFGIVLLRKSRDADSSPWATLGAAILLLIALGIGGCYVSVFWTEFGG